MVVRASFFSSKVSFSYLFLSFSLSYLLFECTLAYKYGYLSFRLSVHPSIRPLTKNSDLKSRHILTITGLCASGRVFPYFTHRNETSATNVFRFIPFIFTEIFSFFFFPLPDADLSSLVGFWQSLDFASSHLSIWLHHFYGRRWRRPDS